MALGFVCKLREECISTFNLRNSLLLFFNFFGYGGKVYEVAMARNRNCNIV